MIELGSIFIYSNLILKPVPSMYFIWYYKLTWALHAVYHSASAGCPTSSVKLSQMACIVS